ncbi:hypothetical protein N781_11170 [Pontibacillus halophilus JSM 076056 = DSM 19796]|uniref:GatB/YqeY domain-containing protein n=1 Tax=Pontibacillus halophilus JSM 076056 = DSM 19796 TaxID=1385510 RepID=A0A0A5GR10_9BACI|nr:GatB/YqeY domain-containing protein [Pontibacillus halophilus]KGX93580.1 hypothetical protein N781_11170 [Pontibacillus halophilus JSM 076056 = DSM 19796]
MSLLERLNQDMKEAMRSKQKERLSVIRMVKASLQNEALKLGKKELSEEEELAVLSRELKQRKDSLQEFKNAGREDLTEKTDREIEIVQAYMPKQLSEDELASIVQETIEEVGASSMKDMGQVMSAVMPKVQGKANGSEVNAQVKKQLS